jgi:hypothetical protein
MGKKKRRMFGDKFKKLRARWAAKEEVAEEVEPFLAKEKVVIEKEEPKIVEVEKPKTTLKKKASPETKAIPIKTKKTTTKKSTRKKN